MSAADAARMAFTIVTAVAVLRLVDLSPEAAQDRARCGFSAESSIPIRARSRWVSLFLNFSDIRSASRICLPVKIMTDMRLTDAVRALAALGINDRWTRGRVEQYAKSIGLAAVTGARRIGRWTSVVHGAISRVSARRRDLRGEGCPLQAVDRRAPIRVAESCPGRSIGPVLSRWTHAPLTQAARHARLVRHGRNDTRARSRKLGASPSPRNDAEDPDPLDCSGARGAAMASARRTGREPSEVAAHDRGGDRAGRWAAGAGRVGDVKITITTERANQIYDILVRETGAAESERDDFVHHVAKEHRDSLEWRFRGVLGFGGKFYIGIYRKIPVRVSYYPEDRSPERDAATEAANVALRAMDWLT